MKVESKSEEFSSQGKSFFRLIFLWISQPFAHQLYKQRTAIGAKVWTGGCFFSSAWADECVLCSLWWLFHEDVKSLHRKPSTYSGLCVNYISIKLEEKKTEYLSFPKVEEMDKMRCISTLTALATSFTLWLDLQKSNWIINHMWLHLMPVLTRVWGIWQSYCWCHNKWAKFFEKPFESTPQEIFKCPYALLWELFKKTYRGYRAKKGKGWLKP